MDDRPSDEVPDLSHITCTNDTIPDLGNITTAACPGEHGVGFVLSLPAAQIRAFSPGRSSPLLSEPGRSPIIPALVSGP